MLVEFRCHCMENGLKYWFKLEISHFKKYWYIFEAVAMNYSQLLCSVYSFICFLMPSSSTLHFLFFMLLYDLKMQSNIMLRNTTK